MKRTIVQAVDATAGQDYHIQTRRRAGEQLLPVTKGFPDDTLDAVALDGAPHMLFSNHQTQARMFELIGAGKNEHFFGGDFEGCRVKDLLEVPWRQ